MIDITNYRFENTKMYSIGEIMEKLEIKSYETFRKYFKNKPGFPKPVVPSKTHPKYDGLALNNFFFKKANKYA